MKLPRDVSGDDLIARLQSLGFSPTRQSGSHVRLTRVANGESFHATIPRHRNLRVGTLSSIIREIARQLDLERDELISKLFQS